MQGTMAKSKVKLLCMPNRGLLWIKCAVSYGTSPHILLLFLPFCPAS